MFERFGMLGQMGTSLGREALRAGTDGLNLQSCLLHQGQSEVHLASNPLSPPSFQTRTTQKPVPVVKRTSIPQKHFFKFSHCIIKANLPPPFGGRGAQFFKAFIPSLPLSFLLLLSLLSLLVNFNLRAWTLEPAWC